MICSFSPTCCEELREEGKWLSKESLLQTKASKNRLIQIVYNTTHILQRISHNNDLINWASDNSNVASKLETGKILRISNVIITKSEDIHVWFFVLKVQDRKLDYSCLFARVCRN